MDPFVSALLKAADEYCALERVSRRQLALQVVQDSKFFSRIQRNDNVTAQTMTRFAHLFAKHDIKIEYDLAELQAREAGGAEKGAAA